MDITNQTKRPLAIPLPGGKKLRLGPGKMGQISPKAAEFPAVKKLVEAGDISIVADGRSDSSSSSGGSGGSGSSGSSQRQGGGHGMRQTGDR
ncbi:MAG: hypothetical protein QF724_04940 [Planctomycetota bacterium]|jgi:hypothetical protein|nr:hypothetical protein [Planctomycetota bacterium]MDP6518489.1 hypothetical protein [Planctomycetota bacterium]MDP6838264.1 hypothetical protein [Planctomycetota bacterium]MDP6954442.1 hypothetical protein [Planctomycetota bacterium]